MHNPHLNASDSIDKAKQAFAVDLFAGDYAEVHLDSRHLADILSRCDIQMGQRYLDIGTGNGFIAFALAGQNPEIQVTGIDIVEQAIAANNQRSQAAALKNLDFISYEGVELPFEDNVFYGALNRYAFHHFPQPKTAVQELYRVLKADGFFIISDPVPDETDRVDFINRLAALKDDGHISFHRERDLVALFKDAGFVVSDKFYSAITFPRKLNAAYETLLASTPAEILQAYRLRLEADVVITTATVLNTCFKKSGIG